MSKEDEDMKKELTKVQKYIVVIVLIFVTAFGIQFAMTQVGQQVKEDSLEKVNGKTE